MGPWNKNKTAYAYNFGPDRPLWRYVFLGALIPFTTLRLAAKLQQRTIPRWQYIFFCTVGGYLGAKHAFNNARVPINPDDMQSIEPFNGRHSTFNYQIWTKEPNGYKWERHKLPHRDRPSLDDVIDERDSNSNYNDGYHDGYRAAMESKRLSQQQYESYTEYERPKPNSASDDPIYEISEFFESNNDKKRRPRNR